MIDRPGLPQRLMPHSQEYLARVGWRLAADAAGTTGDVSRTLFISVIDAEGDTATSGAAAVGSSGPLPPIVALTGRRRLTGVGCVARAHR